jgi:hypothetical protein
MHFDIGRICWLDRDGRDELRVMSGVLGYHGRNNAEDEVKKDLITPVAE